MAEELLAARMGAQRLVDRADDPTELVRAIGAVQAQDPSAAALSVRARVEGLTRAALDRALYEERSIVRTWAMRGTIHLVASDDEHWLRELLAPIAMPAQIRRLDQLGVPESDRRRAVEVIVDALADGPLTRAELCTALERAGIDTAGQKAAHLPRLAALEGHVCFGPRRGGKDTYALVGDWLPPGPRRSLDRDDALAELARRYAGAYGPADPRDFAAWSGLPVRDARRGWELGASDHPAAGTSPPDPPVVRLIPAFDTYLLGYRDRSVAVPAEYERRVWPGGGIIRPAVIANGRAVATWRVARGRVEVDWFARGAHVDVSEEVADVLRFLDGG